MKERTTMTYGYRKTMPAEHSASFYILHSAFRIMQEDNGDLRQQKYEADANAQRQAPCHGKLTMPFLIFFRDTGLVFKVDELGSEILKIAFPAALALAADPIASLIDTAFIGRLGPVEIAAVGVSIAIFNQASRIAIFPLVSITTSFVAEEETVERVSIEPQESKKLEKDMTEDAKNFVTGDDVLGNLEVETKDRKQGIGSDESLSATDINSRKTITWGVKRHVPSASTALVIGGILGLLQTLFLVLGAKVLLGFMGVKSDSPMLNPAERYLTLRAVGVPAVLLSLAMQGVFRGFKDTKTPLYATVLGDTVNIILDPILIFICRMGVNGAAIAHVLSQYLISLFLFVEIDETSESLPPQYQGPAISPLREKWYQLHSCLNLKVFYVSGIPNPC